MLRQGAIFFVCVFLTAFSSAQAQGAEKRLDVHVSQQKMVVSQGGKKLKVYPVSTSRYGTGNLLNSNQTPLGRHRVAQKIGTGAALNTIFRNRVNTRTVSAVNLSDRLSAEDRITSRILWLEGLEPGVNKGRRVDSFRRQIYIHGTPDEGLIGKPASHGCIRMRNADVVQLFDWAEVGTVVIIAP
ncbi:MAG: L,D-transpeptidase family protein [Candidatus Omnitrophota bacterium]